MKNKIKIVLASLLITLGSFVSLGAVVSYANYKAISKVNQLVGYQGALDQTSFFLNANIWEVDNALFYMWDNQHGKWHAPIKTITPTIGGVNFKLNVFILDGQINASSDIVFVRVNPNGRSIPVDGGSTAWDFEAGDGKTIWNQTDNITYAQLHDASPLKDYNYYCVDDWTGGVNYHNNGTEKNSGYTKNRLILDEGSLVFG